MIVFIVLLVNMANFTFPFSRSVLDLFTKSPATVAPGPTVAVAVSDSAGGWRSWICYPIMGAALVVVTVAAVTGHLDKVTQLVAWFGGLWARLKDFRARRSAGDGDDAPTDGGRSALSLSVVDGRNMTDNEMLEANAARAGTSYV